MKRMSFRACAETNMRNPHRRWSWWTDLNPRPADYKPSSPGPEPAVTHFSGLFPRVNRP